MSPYRVPCPFQEVLSLWRGCPPPVWESYPPDLQPVLRVLFLPISGQCLWARFVWDSEPCKPSLLAVRVRDGHTCSGDLAKRHSHATTLSHCALSLSQVLRLSAICWYQDWLETATTGMGSLPHERKPGEGSLGTASGQPPARPWISAFTHKLVVRELQMHLVSREPAWLMMAGRWVAVRAQGT